MGSSTPKPPRIIDRFLHWFCADEVIETLQGDLYELYHDRIDKMGKGRADIHYLFDVLGSLRPFALRRHSHIKSFSLMMVKNNFKVAFRNIRNDGSYNVLNILGLSLGVLAAIIIFLTVKYETTFDEMHANAEELYRVTNNYYYPTFTMHVGTTPDPMAEALATDFPAFTRSFSLIPSLDRQVTVNQEKISSDLLYCGPEFIEAFDFYNSSDWWITGDPKDVLREVNKTVLTESLAETIFGSVDQAMGKMLELPNEIEVEVGGVVRDAPANTNFPFDQLISRLTIEDFHRPTFGGVASTMTFVQLPNAVDPESLRPQLDQFNEKYMEAAWGEDFVSTDLQPLSDIHFDERFGSPNYTTSRSNLWALGLIGLFILLIACINFVNLATAKVIRRSKEIGMRKILGSSRAGIVGQFMTEASLLAVLSIVAGLGLAKIIFPKFSSVTNLNIGNDFYLDGELILFCLGLILFLSIAMGLYPASVLANFKPLQIFRSHSKSMGAPAPLRRGLVGFQLVASQVLIIGAIAATCQLRYFQNADLGFDQESVLVLKINGNESNESKLALKQQCEALTEITGATLTSSIPITGNHSTGGVQSVDSELQERFNVEYVYADNDYVSTMNLNLLAGRSEIALLDRDTAQSFIVNKTLIDRLQFDSPEGAIGKRINVNGMHANIMGVVEDYHTLSMHEAIRPVAIVYGIQDYNSLGLKFRADQLHQVVARAEEAWERVFPDKTFNYYFMDDEMATLYQGEERFSKIITAFTLIAIIIACLGLIGLSAFSAVNRFREIGIRKVLGATTQQILLLMSKEFVVVCLISFLIAAPLAFYFISRWLEGFAYPISIEWWMFAGAGLSAVTITVLTVGLHSMKAALSNPISAIKVD